MDTWGWFVLGTTVPVLVIIVSSACAAGLPILRRLVPALMLAPSRTVTGALAFVVAAIFLLGLVGIETVTPYWAPFHPFSLSSAYMQRLNGVILHAGATTLGKHLLALTLYAFAVLMVMIPTALWAFALLGLVKSRDDRTPELYLTYTIALILILGALLQPLASVAAGLPFANRYFDLSLALLACGLILVGLPTLTAAASLRARGFAAVAIAFVLGLVVETAPFRPLFAAFRPFWLSYPDAQRAEPGRLNASWMGWGEEIMTGGKMLEEACEQGDVVVAGHSCRDITLYVMNSGLWLPGPSKIHMDMFASKKDAPPLDDKSFYIVDRLYLIQDVYNIPQIAPDLSVAYRGYDLAWIFRGDRLAASGYRFGRAAFRSF
jgi:hypothetical protein